MFSITVVGKTAQATSKLGIFFRALHKSHPFVLRQDAFDITDLVCSG